MLNHSDNATATFEYCDEKKGFCLLASSDLPENVEIFDSYGLGTNKTKYNNYGFFEDHHFTKAAYFGLGLHNDDKFLEQKTKLLASNPHGINLEARHTLNTIKYEGANASQDMI